MGDSFFYSANYSTFEEGGPGESWRESINEKLMSDDNASGLDISSAGVPQENNDQNWFTDLSAGSSKYLTNMYGRSQEIHDITKSKTRAKDIKKLLRSQCINDSNTNLNHREWKSNDNYFDGLIRNQRDESDVNSLINSGLYLTRTYKEGRDNLLNYYSKSDLHKDMNLYNSSGVNVFPFDINQESSNPEQNWKYTFNSLYYPNQTEYTTTDGVLSINASSKGRGLLNYNDNDKFGTAIKCVSVNDNSPDTGPCVNYNTTGGESDDDIQKKLIQCDNAPECKIHVDISNAGLELLDTKDSDLRLNHLKNLSDGTIDATSAIFKDGDDLGDGLYGRWDSTLSMCNWISPIDKCVGTLQDNRPSNDRSGELNSVMVYMDNDESGVSSCRNYLNDLVNGNTDSFGMNGDQGNNINLDSDPLANNDYMEKLCTKAGTFSDSGGQNTIDAQNNNLTNIDTGCRYIEQQPDFYKDLNLVDKCSVDDLYKKLRESGMTPPDIDKIEFTDECQRRQIGYELDFACSDKTGRFLSKTQNMFSCTGQYMGSNGEVNKEDGSESKTDCVDPIVLNSYNYLYRKYNNLSYDGDNPEDSRWSPGVDDNLDDVDQYHLNILNERGSNHKLAENGELQNDCYWQPILKEKEYVDENTTCRLKCKGGSIQNGNQPVCKPPPNHTTDSGSLEIGYLNPYLNPEWDLNNFSCTALEEKGCEGEGDGNLAISRTWNPNKQIYESKVEKCPDSSAGEDEGLTLANFITGGPASSKDWFWVSVVSFVVLVIVAVVAKTQNWGEAKFVLIVLFVFTVYTFLLGYSYMLSLMDTQTEGFFNLAYKKAHIWNALSFSVVFILLAIDGWGRRQTPHNPANGAIIEPPFIGLIALLTLLWGIQTIGVFMDNDPIQIDITDESTLNEFEKNAFVTQFDAVDDSGDSAGPEISVRNMIGEYRLNYWTTYRQDILFFGFFFTAIGVLVFACDETKQAAYIFGATFLLYLIVVGLGIYVNPTIMGTGDKKELNIWGANSAEFWLYVIPTNSGFLSNPYLTYNEGTPRRFDDSPIPIYKCNQYSDCKYSDNCVWDEIVSIIDGPQDFRETRNPKDAGWQMAELMYGFIYIIHKYDNKKDTNDVYFTDEGEYSWDKLFNTANTDNGGILGQNIAGGPSPTDDIERRDIYVTGTGMDPDNNIIKWVTSWGEFGENQFTLKDNNGNRVSICDLIIDYGLSKNDTQCMNSGIASLQRTFLYYWNYFHNGDDGKLRNDILNIMKSGGDNPPPSPSPPLYTIQDTDTFYTNLMTYFVPSEDSERGDILQQSEIKKSIPILKIILKNWLHENLVVKFNVNPGENKGTFTGCEINNRVCTFGVNEYDGTCKDSCENDELLDYTQGLCQDINGENERDYSNLMEYQRPDDMPRTKSLREYGPNFQRFYCEMGKKEGDIDIIADSYYQKAGCIKNDFLNNDAIKGESCRDYRERAESSGYNIDCNSSESKAHYNQYRDFTHLNSNVSQYITGDSSKDCASGVTATTPENTKYKICGYDNTNLDHHFNYEWNDDSTINLTRTVGDTIYQYAEGNTHFNDELNNISPIVTCCDLRLPDEHPECIAGNWVRITNSGDSIPNKHYCSHIYNNDTVSLDDAANELEIGKEDLCGALGIDQCI